MTSHHLCRLLFCCVAAVLCIACSRVGPPVAAGHESADADLASYLRELHANATQSPDSADLRGELAMAYDVNGLNDAAVQSYSDAEKLNTDDVRWPYFLALSLAAQGDPEGAVDAIDRAIELEPDYQPSWLGKGGYLMDLGLATEAVTAYQRALDIEDTPQARAGLASAFMRSEQHQAAADALEPISEDRNPFIQRLWGRALRELGRTEEAEAALLLGSEALPLAWPDEKRTALLQHARGLKATLEVASELLANGQSEEAVAKLENLRRKYPDDDIVLSNLSSAYARSGNIAKSDEVLRDALQAHPDSFSFNLNYANRLLAQDRLDRALHHAERALELSPGLSPANEIIGAIRSRRGDIEGAMGAYRAAGSPTGFYRLALHEGTAGRWQDAIESLRKSVQLDPANGRTLVFLARSLAEAGEFDEAMATLRKARLLRAPPNEVASALQRLQSLKQLSQPIRVDQIE